MLCTSTKNRLHVMFTLIHHNTTYNWNSNEYIITCSHELIIFVRPCPTEQKLLVLAINKRHVCSIMSNWRKKIIFCLQTTEQSLNTSANQKSHKQPVVAWKLGFKQIESNQIIDVFKNAWNGNIYSKSWAVEKRR